MPDEQRFDRPLFVLRDGKVAEDNVKEFFEWRKRTDPEAYKAAMGQLAEIFAEAALRQVLAEDAKREGHRSHSLVELEPEGNSAFQALSNSKPRIVPLTDIEAIRAAGVLYPATVDGWRWLYRQRAARGMTHVFLRVGRRIMIDLPAYEAVLRRPSVAPER
jgi:hypothetical protein